MNSCAPLCSQALASLPAFPLRLAFSPRPRHPPAAPMLSTESFAGPRALGEESLQMWDLNKRLEAYLARVKFLEEENEVLRAEIQSAKGSPAGDSWRAKYEEELRALRDALDVAFREKCTAELARDNLYEEVQQVKSRCQKEQAAREEAKKQLALSRKELEEERRAQIWLKERAVQLEKEVEALLEVHEEEKAGLDQEIATFSHSLESFRCAPVAFQPVEVEDYSKRLSEIWEEGAARGSRGQGRAGRGTERLPPAHGCPSLFADLRLEVSKAVPASPEARRLLPREPCSTFPRLKSDAPTPQSARELQKVTSALCGSATGRAGGPAAPTPSPPQAGKASPPLSPEPPSPCPPEPQSSGGEGPAWPGGDEAATSRGTERPLSGASGDSGSASALGAAHRLRYPAQLVSEALEDALKAMGEDAQPQEEPTAGSAWAPRDVCAPSPVLAPEGCGEAVSERPGDGQEPSEGSEDGESPEAEQRLGEVMLRGLAGDSSVLQGRAPSPPGAAAPLSASGSREDLGAWEEEEEEEEEEVPAVLSPRDPEVEAQEGDKDLPGRTETSWEKPEEERAESPSTEPSHPEEEEEEEERAPCSPCEEKGDFQEEGTDAQEEERPHREVEAARAVLVGSHLVLPTEGHLEEDFADAEQEKSEQQKMPLWEMDLAAGKEREQELCPEQEPSSAHEAIPAEEPPTGAAEDAEAGEDTGRVEEAEGEKGEASREVLGGEDHGVGQDPTAGEDPEAGEDLGAEEGEHHGAGEGSEAGGDPGPGEDLAGDTLEGDSRAPEEPEELQEREGKEQEQLEPGEQPWGQGGDGSDQEPCPEDWEVTAGDTEAVLGPEEPAWTDDTPSSAGRLQSEGRDGPRPAELEEAQEDDEEDAKSQEMRQQRALPEAEPAAELAQQQQGSAAEPEPAPPGAPGHGDGQELAEAPEQPRELQDEDTAEGLSPELGQLESSELGALGQGPGDSSEWALEETPRDPELTELGALRQGPGASGEWALEETPGDPEPTELGQLESSELGALRQVPGDSSEWALEETPRDPELTELGQLGLVPGASGEWALEETPRDPEPTELGQLESSELGALGQGPGDSSEWALEETPRDPEPTELGALRQGPGDSGKWALEETPGDPEPTEFGELESSELGALGQGPGDSSEWALEETPRDPEPTEGTGRRVELEDTLPDSTPLHLYQGESPKPPESEETTETAPGGDAAREGEAWLEGRDKPPTPSRPESPEEEAEGAEEEEEGYFMVSAPNQEVSSSEEAEMPEDFEEIKVEAAEGGREDLGAPGEASPGPEGKEHLEGLAAEADEDMEMPTEEPEVPKDEEDTAELEEGPEEDASCLGVTGPAAGGSAEPAQGPEHPEGLAAEPDEELHDTPKLEGEASGAATLPGCTLGLAGQEEEEEDEDEPSTALHDTAKATAEPDGAEQPLEEQPPAEEEAVGSESPPSAGASPPQPGSALGQGAFPEVTPDGPALPAEVPADVMRDSGILEIVEQALEFNQELMGARVAEAGQGPGRAELSRDAGEDSSLASSSEEEPTVQEAPEVEGTARAENGLHREASLEELAEFSEEVPNGLSSTAPAQELPTDTTEPSGVMPPQAPTPGDGTATKLGDGTLRSKRLSPVPAALGEDVLCLTAQQPPACGLRAEQEPWSSGDE
ncbi:nestin [Motacilla alba alba]|uniref:nestin n=1 Tax=Motacilla alba alba TaxID=1094192 RepID=UPI0018D57D18|nr:nestin [Motacilla alba alba]